MANKIGGYLDLNESFKEIFLSVKEKFDEIKLSSERNKFVGKKIMLHKNKKAHISEDIELQIIAFNKKYNIFSLCIVGETDNIYNIHADDLFEYGTIIK